MFANDEFDIFSESDEPVIIAPEEEATPTDHQTMMVRPRINIIALIKNHN